MTALEEVPSLGASEYPGSLLMNPLANIRKDRQVARSHQDSNADIAFLALSQDGKPSVRTLVLRDVDDHGVSLFINKTSNKWQSIVDNPNAELLLWYSSIQRQYRISGQLHEIQDETIENNWQRRPAPSKYLDHAYEELAPQSSILQSRDVLVNFIRTFRENRKEIELHTPPNATGVVLRPESIECLDLNNVDRIHDRRKYQLTADGKWQALILMP